MHFMRTITILIASLLLTLSGCSKPAAGPTTATASSGKKIKIGVSIPAADHGWTAGVGYWATTQMAKYSDSEVEWVYATANEPGKQTSDIEDMMSRGIDGLVVLATESAPLTPVVEKAKLRGIYIVNVDRGLLKPVADVVIEGDNKAFGE